MRAFYCAAGIRNYFDDNQHLVRAHFLSALSKLKDLVPLEESDKAADFNLMLTSIYF